jgi:SPP1 family predicted phage head-tail adaptor
MTAPGELNRRLVLEEPVETADGGGGIALTYAASVTLWAKVEPVSARNIVVGDAPGATVTHRITIRSGPNITTRHRFMEGARVYRVADVREDATRRFLVIGAEQRIE